MISSQAPSIVHAIPRRSKQNAHPGRFSNSGDYAQIQNRGRWIARTCPTAIGDVSNGTESTLLHTAPDCRCSVGESSWSQGWGNCCIREDPALETEAHTCCVGRDRKDESLSRAAKQTVVSEWGSITQRDPTQDYQWKASGLCLPPPPAASAASTAAEVLLSGCAAHPWQHHAISALQQYLVTDATHFGLRNCQHEKRLAVSRVGLDGNSRSSWQQKS